MAIIAAAGHNERKYEFLGGQQYYVCSENPINSIVSFRD